MAYLIPHFFAFPCSLLVILLFKMIPKYGAKMLSNVLQNKKAMMCFWRKYVR